MLFLLSPAKSLDYESPLPPALAKKLPATEPQFVPQSAKLIEVLRAKTPAQIAGLMDLSDKLAALNTARYAAWEPRFHAGNARQAVLAFNGDVYDGLEARSLTPKQLEWAQQHVAILSGLYGVLRPLDLMQPYRLEMGTRLATGRGQSLYDFWGSRIADYLNQQQAGEERPIVVNLASQEYFRSVDRRVLRARVVDCTFEDWKNGQYKIISFFAKKARGLMARHAVQHRAGTLAALKKFDADGYAFAADVSTADHLVFRRRVA
ncbi:MAG: peroxide stress protein YaaA [Comamonas sp.]